MQHICCISERGKNDIGSEKGKIMRGSEHGKKGEILQAFPTYYDQGERKQLKGESIA
ncbi:MAG: hypothetical protein GY705_22015 [Bacteroidetes bacterium]|nr:hypothetical protein [Bacteroidota bacterium]